MGLRKVMEFLIWLMVVCTRGNSRQIILRVMGIMFGEMVRSMKVFGRRIR
jgi:hypothetical protein